MKTFKNLMALVLALVLTLSLMNFAAAEDGPVTGTITINGVSAEAKYEVYKLLDLESYDISEGAYSYKVNRDWAEFFALAEVQTYVTIDATGYVTWKENKNTAADVETFAQKALAYAEDHGIAPVQSSETDGQFVITGGAGVFSNLTLGYYLVDSSVGALCGLTTTNPNAAINSKNGAPTLDKQVKEDSTDQWSDANTADIGQTVEFRTTINVHDGAQNYVLHDKMSAGLTFDPDSITIHHVIPGTTTTEGTLTPENYYTLVTKDTVENGLDDDCTFEIRFTSEFCNHLSTNDKIIVHYSAILNENAIVGTDGNPNETKLSYGDNHFTAPDVAKTKTFGFDIIKTDAQNKLITGAEFSIWTAETGGEQIAVVAQLVSDEDGHVKEYVRANSIEEEGATYTLVLALGAVRVDGFDNGTYYLAETKAPNGFNQLTERRKFIISDGNLYSTFNDGIYSVNSGVQIVNKTGAMLPETGGVGTTLFYIAGGVLVAAAVVLLITRKRMSEN